MPLHHTPPHIPGEYINVDLFAGGGGASLGMEMAGYRVHAAVNHNPQAVAIHAINHPHTEHWVQDIYTVSPRQVTRGRPVGWLWASPDCTHHSKAKGGPPTRNARRRELAMVLPDRWLPELGEKRPLGMVLENVEEFEDWGPLDRWGRIIDAEKGVMFQRFVKALRRFGYKVEWRRLRACDYGAPTIRQRLFITARRDGMPIVWPQPTHGDPKSSDVKSGRLKPWRTAAEIIDWSVPCPSIFETAKEIKAKHGIRARRPLKKNTLRRVAKGIQRYVIESASPFIVDLSHTKRDGSYDCFRGCGPNDPLPTITQSPGMAVCAPFVQHIQHSSAPGGVMPADEPLRTITAHPKGGGMALVAPVVAEMRTGSVGHGADEPLHTVSAGGTHHALVAAFMSAYYGNDAVPGQEMDSPMRTVVGHDRHGLVTVMLDGHPWVIADIGMRMLKPRELARGNGFPDWYVIERRADGKPVTQQAQVAMIGNSVPPDFARALLQANPLRYPERVEARVMPLLEACHA